VSIPKLEQRIPKDLLPEILIVDDEDDRTGYYATFPDSAPDSVREYKRVYPKPPNRADGDVPQTAHLKLSSVPCLGKGRHAEVYQAHLTLGEPFRLVGHESASSPACVSVAAKIAFTGKEDRDMLENEARIYGVLPAHFSEDWSGFNALLESTRYGDGRVPATAVVPKFYGFFVPVHQPPDTSQCEPARPILMMEECGTPIKAAKLKQDQRCDVRPFASIRRLK
jgi:hypothetical protein